jgi:RNA polymerase sigma-70 factor (ECF subfamily)
MGNNVAVGSTSPTLPAFEAFYREHATPLRRALSLALGDVDLAREAADEAMTRVYERWSRLDHADNPSGWAYRVGLNWANSRRRRYRWRDKRPVPDREVAAVPSDPELTSALAGLSVEHRTVVVCRYYLDWSVETTAHALEIPVGTVKSRLARALDHLQHSLEVRHGRKH